MKKYANFWQWCQANPEKYNVAELRKLLKDDTKLTIIGTRSGHGFPLGSTFLINNNRNMVFSTLGTLNFNSGASALLSQFNTTVGSNGIYFDDFKVNFKRTKTELEEELKTITSEYETMKSKLTESINILTELGIAEEDEDLVRSYRIIKTISGTKGEKEKALAVAELLKT